jgi:hypothetical protein
MPLLSKGAGSLHGAIVRMKKISRLHHSTTSFLLFTRALFSTAALMLAATTANADPVNVPNGSFEASGPSQTSSNANVIPGWVFAVKDGSAYGSADILSNFSSLGAASGNDYAYVNNDAPNDTDTITSAASLGTIQPLTDYTLTVAIGNRNGTGLYDNPGNVSFSLLGNGTVFATQTVNGDSILNGTFQDYSLTFTTPDAGALIGESLTIQLASLPEQNSAYQPGFDNVTLDATPLPQSVPEPSTWLLVAGGFFALVWRLRCKYPFGMKFQRV